MFLFLFVFLRDQADLVFVKLKPKAARKIDYARFKDCVNLIAHQKSMGYLTLAQKIVDAGGPKSSGTVADAVKFHDDKNLWTGAYGERVERKAPERTREGTASPPSKPLGPSRETVSRARLGPLRLPASGALGWNWQTKRILPYCAATYNSFLFC